MSDLAAPVLPSPPRRETESARADLAAMVKRVRQRRAWTAWTDLTLDGLFYAYFGLACLFLVDRIRAGAMNANGLSTPLAVVLALLSATALASGWAAVRAFWRGPRDVEVAFLTDRRFGLEDRFSTAIDLCAQLNAGTLTGRSAELARAQVEDAARFVRVQDASQVFPARPLGDRWTSAIALLIALWIALLPQEDFRRTDPRKSRPVAEAGGAVAEPAEPRAGVTKSRVPVPGARPQPQPGPGGGGKGQQPQPGGGGGDQEKPEPDPQEDPGGGDGGGGRNAPPTGPQESPERLFGEPERAAAQIRPKEVEGLEGEGPTRTEERTVYTGDPGAGGEPGQPVPLDFPALLAEYRRVAEQTLRQERIPPPDRELVRRYFEAIGPKD